jgi:RNA polymerase sigma-70 factor, ECF subfamily
MSTLPLNVTVPPALKYPKKLTPPVFDAEYLGKLRHGDPDTERHFVTHFSNVIRMAMRYRLRSWELIEDIRQETFLRVLNFLRSDRSLDHPERLGAYVHSVSINVMLELLRASTRHPPLPEDSTHFPDSKASAEESVVTRERKEIVKDILAELSVKDREILKALFLEDADKDDVSKRFEVDRDYLRVLVHRAKIRFREVYEKRNLPVI